jgi:hypothetical protein
MTREQQASKSIVNSFFVSKAKKTFLKFYILVNIHPPVPVAINEHQNSIFHFLCVFF